MQAIPRPVRRGVASPIKLMGNETRHQVTTNNRTSRLAELTALGSVFVLASSVTPAWAYLDPGTGSMMLQLMLGGVAGALVVGKLYLHRAREFFRNVGRRIRAG
jgi:hypothetical protein